ncbi:tRNA (mnm(5)s(2)U34)-methyltransferase [Miniphocaeibacter massiliensis]|uniref:tRNA (mnm(5)s(2)U34)-methyltransferase n=1 Tax=Miniphocaeibacter massiliensis TaxID=2041841 RepID=UPI000C06B20F|nr:class I SAM-dependent methyltransferase [Miniphocaeibacter massiliensis]
MFNNFYNTKSIVDYYINKFKNKEITAVDMTAGNGNDIYNIAKTVNINSKIYGFDILEKAIEKSKEKLSKLTINCKLILDSHSNIKNYIYTKIDLAIYNLGFLPGGDKNITTNYSTVLESLNYLITMLNNGGIVIFTFYPGHKSGLEESEKIEEYLSKLNQKEYNVLKFNFINQINNPPYVVVIERGNVE